MRLDTDGQLLWRTEDLADKIFHGGMAYADGVLFVSVRTKTFPITTHSVFAIDTSDGSIIWEKEFRNSSAITTIEIHPKGLLIAYGGFSSYRGSDFTPTYQPGVLALLDLQTGRGWTRTMPVGWRSEWLSEGVSGIELPMVLDDDALYLAVGGALTSLNLEDGSLNEIARYQFKDNESPTSLSLIDGNLFLNSSHNFAGFDSGGGSLYQKNYKAPGPSGWVKAAAIALDIGIAIYDVVDSVKCVQAWSNDTVGNQRCQRYLQIASERYSRKFPFWEWGPDDVEAAWRDSASLYQQLAIVGNEIFRDSLAKRYGTTVNAERSSYVYFEEEYRKDDDPKFGLALYDKYSGKEMGQLWLNQRKPEFALDPVTRTVFAKSSKKVIQALKFDALKDPEEESEPPAHVFFYRTRWNGGELMEDWRSAPPVYRFA